MPMTVAEQMQQIRLDPELLATIEEWQKSLNGDLTIILIGRNVSNQLRLLLDGPDLITEILTD
ncbi:MAG: hypothetical protein R3E79_57220 [Caldilineaceae bacterium]